MYKEECKNGLKPQSWADFMDQFLIVIVADGYLNLGYRNINENTQKSFKTNAQNKGFLEPEWV
jgi:hypothetical protein